MRQVFKFYLFIGFSLFAFSSFALPKKSTKETKASTPPPRAVIVEPFEFDAPLIHEFACLGALNQLEADYPYKSSSENSESSFRAPGISESRLRVVYEPSKREDLFLKADKDSVGKAIEIVYTKHFKDNSRGYLVISPNGAVFHKQSEIPFQSQLEKGQKKFSNIKDRYQSRLSSSSDVIPDIFIQHEVTHYYDLNEKLTKGDQDYHSGEGSFSYKDFNLNASNSSESHLSSEAYPVEEIKKLLYPYIADKVASLGQAIEGQRPPFFQRALDAMLLCKEIPVDPSHQTRGFFSVAEPDQRIRERVNGNLTILTLKRKDAPKNNGKSLDPDESGTYQYLGAIDPQYTKKPAEYFPEEKSKYVKGKAPSANSKTKH